MHKSFSLAIVKWAILGAGVYQKNGVCAAYSGLRHMLIPTGNERPPGPKSSEAHLHEYEARLIQRWADLCFNKHTKCGHDTQYLPTRVIEVGTTSSPTLRLISSSDIVKPDRRYLALSHCWGLTMPDSAKTTSMTLESHSSRIEYQALPLTFQDFIEIARRLGIFWVWIDSLCIIQDSREDWENEASQMADVYAKSYLTIAASGSAGSGEGCRVNQEARSYGPIDVDCLETDSSTTPETQRITRSFRIWARDPNPITSVLQNNPLNKRGWTLQERELAPRVVHYSQDTIRWECCELAATLEFPCGDTLPFDAGRLFDGGSDFRSPQFGDPRNDSKQLNMATKQSLAWFELVQRYTARSLTKQADILPAVSGIARSIMSKTQDKYIAGLWESYFAHCLLWVPASRSGESFKHYRRTNYLAPTWSWASMNGPIEYSINGSWYSFNPDPDPAFLPNLLEVSLSPSGSDPYGMLQAGYMKIQGKFQVAYSIQGQGNQLYSMFSGTAPNQIGWIQYDVPLCTDCAPPGRMEFVFLMCCMNSEKSKGDFNTFALAMKPKESEMVFGFDLIQFIQKAATDGIESFQRVGVAKQINPSFWDKAFNLTVTVV